MAHNASKEITVNTQAPSTASGAVAWQEAIDELEFRRSQAEALGGTDAVARHHDAGRLSIRERINGLVDSGSFQAIGKLTGQGRYDGTRLVSVQPATYVMGLAQIDGKRVIGRASCRERVWQYVYMSGVGASIKKKKR